MNVVKKNRLLFSVTSIVDFLYIVVFFIVYFIIMFNVFNLLLRLSGLMQSIEAPSLDILDSQRPIFSKSADFLALSSQLFEFLYFLAVVMFVLWIIFQGVNFFLASRTARKVRFWPYIGKFSLFSLFFYIFVVLSFLLTVYLSMVNSVVPVITQGIITFVVFVLLIIISYFWFISLVAIQKNKIIPAFLKTFSVGFREFKKIIKTYLLSFMLLLAGLLILAGVFKINMMAFYFTAVFGFVPLISLLRLFFINNIERLF
ncbi:hypothetical protein GOV09_06400 [Candidatus Woesearchaeota archaeon]|nr:hypothetical protein [Candidatus Woesearchaeota archaeon]